MRIYRLLAILLVIVMICGCNVDSGVNEEASTEATKDTTAQTTKPTQSTTKPEGDDLPGAGDNEGENENNNNENNNGDVNEGDKEEEKEENDTTLKILTIGNSFSDDTMQYMYQIAEAAGYKSIILGNLYIGGCSLTKHANNAKNNSASYSYRYNDSGKWVNTENYKMDDAIKSQDWDYISLQQSSGNSGKASTYTDLDYMISHVKTLDPKAKLVWNMTWAYQKGITKSEFEYYDNSQSIMYESIVLTVLDCVATKRDISIIVPNGTAIQNARTSYIGDTLTRDGYHLSYDMGRYTAGLTFFHALTGKSIENLSYMPSGVDKNLQKIAIESAMNAVKEPWDVTNSVYTEEPLVDLDEYELLEIDWTPLAYWNSKNTGNPLVKTASNSPEYYASQIFSKEELPVGSIIIVSEGWKYRPDAWVTLGTPLSTTRPGEVSTEKVVVTDAWWGNYNHRAFNLSSAGGGSLESVDSDIVENSLKIYVPKNS